MKSITTETGYTIRFPEHDGRILRAEYDNGAVAVYCTSRQARRSLAADYRAFGAVVAEGVQALRVEA